MVNCVACGRSRTTKTKNMKFSLHRFPVNPKVRKAWVAFVGKADWEPAKNSFICSQHFEEIYFDRTSVNRIQLKKEAVPTIRIERLKYDRDIIPTAEYHMEDPLAVTSSTFSEIEIILLPDETIPAVPSTGCLQSPQPGTSAAQESAIVTSLKLTIRDLQNRERIREKKMRSLQKKCWYQQERLFQVSSALRELQKKQLINKSVLR